MWVYASFKSSLTHSVCACVCDMMSPYCDLDRRRMWSTSCGYGSYTVSLWTLFSTHTQGHTHWLISTHGALASGTYTNIDSTQAGAVKVRWQTLLATSWHVHHRPLSRFRALLPLCGHLKCSKWLRFVHLALIFAQAWMTLFEETKGRKRKTHPPAQAKLRSFVWCDDAVPWN